MPRKLVTCPECKVDQHVYRNKIARHDFCSLTCVGSGTPIKATLTRNDGTEAVKYAWDHNCTGIGCLQAGCENNPKSG